MRPFISLVAEEVVGPDVWLRRLTLAVVAAERVAEFVCIIECRCTSSLPTALRECFAQSHQEEQAERHRRPI